MNSLSYLRERKTKCSPFLFSKRKDSGLSYEKYFSILFMNNFEKTFFKKYVAEGQEIIDVFHKHFIIILDDLILAFFLGVFIPVFMYYNSLLIQEYIPFYYFEIYLFFVYVIIIYKIFDWYNDVLILTNSWVIKLEWSLFKSNSISVDYEHIEWVEVNKNSFLDTILKKWDLIIHKFWEDEIVLQDASKPYKILNKIEEITSQIEQPEEIDKFELMMDTLSSIVKDYVSAKWIQKEDIFNNSFEDEISHYSKEVQAEAIKNSNLSIEEKQDFLNKIKQQDGTIDLR